MSSAGLAVVRRAHLDRVRVAALSVAISLNLAALVFALRPLAPKFAEIFASVRPPTTIRFIEPPPQPPLPPDIAIKRFTKPVPVTAPARAPVPQVQHVTAPVDTAAPTTEPSDNSKPVVAPPSNAGPTIAPGEVSLAYRSSPLKFPTQALRMHMQGTVLLRVLVDESGKPVDVVVEHSSGYPLLDKSAREQVLASWQFQPAVLDGHAVKAWARVPVTFALQEM